MDPAAPAETAPAPSAAPARPDSVTLAVNLIYGSLAAGIVRLALSPMDLPTNVPSESEETVRSVAIAVALATFAIMALFPYFIGRGKSWVRFAFVALFAIGLLPAAAQFAQSFARGLSEDGIIGIAQIAMQGYASFLLLQRPANEWFAAMKAVK